LAGWRTRVQKNWPQVRIQEVEIEPFTEIKVDSTFWARARVHLGPLSPDDVKVELYLGRVDASDELVEAEAMPMQIVKQNGAGSHLFEASAVSCVTSGRHGYTVRVLPYHPDLTTPLLPGLIAWA
jgi:starch phosphorylase